MNDLIVFLAKYAILIPLAVNLYIFWKLDPKNRKKMLLLGVCGAILSFVLAKAAGHFYNNPRPPFKDGSKPLFTPSDRNGFPSDHTLLASWLAFVAITYSKKLGVFLFIVALVIGWARVAAHVHHAVDIIGSLLITAAVFVVLSGALKMGTGKGSDGGHQKTES